VSGLRARIGVVGALVALSAYLTFANFASEETRLASPLLPDQGLRLGLDLQGGIHWVLGVKLEAALEHELEFLSGNLADAAERDGFTVTDVDIENAKLIVETPDAAAATAVREWAERTKSLH